MLAIYDNSRYKLNNFLIFKFINNEIFDLLYETAKLFE